MVPITVLIPAYNAVGTIERAVTSAMMENPEAILLIDDGSNDATVEVAIRAADSRLRVIRKAENGGVAAARNTALQSVESIYAIWLDSDDELMPGRAARMTDALRNGADVVYAGVTLLSSDAPPRPCPIPEFMFQPWGGWRLYERNWVQGIGCPAVRVDAVRDIRYDETLICAEDYDFALRSVASGKKVSFLGGADYGYHLRSQSLSRDLEQSNADTGKVLRKHDARQVAEGLEGQGMPKAVAIWCAALMSVQQGHYDAALSFLHSIRELGLQKADVLEPDGPYPIPNGCREDFLEGTLHLLQGKAAKALPFLKAAAEWGREREVQNNLAVALAQSGDLETSRRILQGICADFPHYQDAVRNLSMELPTVVTRLPLRRPPSRSRY